MHMRLASWPICLANLWKVVWFALHAVKSSGCRHRLPDWYYEDLSFAWTAFQRSVLNFHLYSWIQQVWSPLLVSTRLRLGTWQRLFYWTMDLTSITANNSIVWKWMGLEMQPGIPLPRRDNAALCITSLIKHVLAVSNIYLFKKYIWLKVQFFELWHIKPLTSEVQLYQHVSILHKC